MVLLSETNEQYYAGQQAQVAVLGQRDFIWTADTSLVATTGTTNTNFKVLVDNVVWTEIPGTPLGGTQYQLSAANTVTFPAMTGGEIVVIE